MHDAIALANLLYALPSRTGEDVTRIFEEYQAERLPAVQVSFKNSQLMSKFMEKSFIGAIILFLITHMPMWLWRLAVSVPLLIFVFECWRCEGGCVD